MVYRGGLESGPACAKHAAAPAGAACARCLQPICDLCIVYFGAQPHCHPCSLEARRNRTVGRVLLALASLALGTGGLLAVRYTMSRPDPHVDSPDVQRLRAESAADRCSHATTLAFEEALLQDGQPRAALDDAAAFFARCGDWYRLHWVAYTAHERLGEWQGAIDEATKLVDHKPTDHDYYWWRGQAEEKLGQLDRAVADYRMTLVRLPKISNIPFNLADGYEKLGQPCRALSAVEHFLYFHPEERETPGVQVRLARLLQTGNCAGLAGHGATLVKPWGDPKALDGRVRLGRVQGRFAVEPGDAYVVITRKLAEQLGLALAAPPSLQIDVGGALQPARLVTLPELAIDGARAAQVEAAVVELPALEDGLDGRIGLSFLTRFHVSLDADDPDGELGLVAP